MRARPLVILLLAILLLLLVPGLALARARSNGPASAPAPSVATYVVGPGDTLWSIASRIAPGRDPRPVIDRLQADNHLHGSLQAGQTLIIPASSR